MITNDYDIVRNFDKEIQNLLASIQTDSQADRDKIAAILDLHSTIIHKSAMDALTDSTKQLSQTYKSSIDALILSNKELSQSSERQARSLTVATWVLVFATAAVIFGDKINMGVDTLWQWLLRIT